MDPDSITDKLALETAKIPWSELQRLFASGVVVVVNQGQDLIAVAERFVADDKVFVERLMVEDKIHNANLEDAASWHERDASVWAVVVAPWVLVQDADTSLVTK